MWYTVFPSFEFLLEYSYVNASNFSAFKQSLSKPLLIFAGFCPLKIGLLTGVAASYFGNDFFSNSSKSWQCVFFKFS